MTCLDAQTVIQALGLPDSCQVGQRVPKKILLENIAATAADKRLITDNISEIKWLAALKPNTIGVPDYRDTKREYLEITILSVTLRGVVKPANRVRLAELLHRAVPYPVLLQLVEGQIQTLFLAHKRWAQNEFGKVVLDGSLVYASFFHTMVEAPETACLTSPEVGLAFLQSLSISRQPQATLYSLYQGWIDCVQTLLAARLTGIYRIVHTQEQAEARRQALNDYERLEIEINRLRGLALKEKQMARQVELNLQLQALLAERQRIVLNL